MTVDQTNPCGTTSSRFARTADAERRLFSGKRLFIVAGLTLSVALPAAAVVPAFAAPKPAAEKATTKKIESDKYPETPQHQPDNLPPFESYPAALKTVADLDAAIAKLGGAEEVAQKIKSGTLPEEQQKLLLQRSLIKDAGYEELQKFAQKSQDHSKFLQWLLSDFETLKLYVTGGAPGGADPNKAGSSHVRSIQQFMDIARKYPGDLAPTNPDRDVLRKMMIAASLGMSDTTRLWVGNENPVADHMDRYYIVKTMRDQSGTYDFQKGLFDQLKVQNMRWVFESRIANEEMPWLSNYSRSLYPSDATQRRNAYNYIEYRTDFSDHGGYNDPEFFDQNALYKEAISQEPNDKGAVIKGGWKAKYKFEYDDPNFPNKEVSDPYYYYQYYTPGEKLRLWMPFEDGGVCGALGKTTENLYNLVGIPAAEAGQPRHSICFTYYLVTDPKTKQQVPKYHHWGNAWDWLNTNLPNAGNILCGWRPVHSVHGEKEETDPTNKVWPGGTFTFMAQDALNNLDDFTKVWELRMLAEAQSDRAIKVKLFDIALGIQPYNLDIFEDYIELYAGKKSTARATDDEWLALADKVVNGCVAYPYPMHSLLVRMRQEQPVTDATNDLRLKLDRKRMDGLEKSKKLNESDTIWAKEAQEVAKRLLGEQSSQMFTFSFDGEDAGVVKLGPQFNSYQVTWEYSIDGGRSWKTAPQGDSQVKLSDEELAQVNAKDDIRFKVSGVGDDVSKIDITEGVAPTGISANEDQKGLYLENEADYGKVEVFLDGTWQKLTKGMKLPANTDLKLRTGATGTSLASKGDQIVTMKIGYSETPTDAKPISPADLSINGATQSIGGTRPEWAVNGTLDDRGQYWESDRRKDPYIQVDLGSERTISYIDWVRRGHGKNGNPFKVQVYVGGDELTPAADGDAGEQESTEIPLSKLNLVGEYDISWSQSKETFRIDLGKAVDARYVRLIATNTKGWKEPGGGTLSAKELTFWEQDKSLENAKADLKLASDSITFPETSYGAVTAPVSLGLTNAGTGFAVIDSVVGELSGSSNDGRTFDDVFKMSKGNGEIAPGEADDSWTIAPASSLPAGAYDGVVTVTYHDVRTQNEQKTLKLAVHQTVTKAENRTIDVSLLAVAPDSITLAESKPSIGGGAVEYALSTTAEAPVDGWQQGTAFDGLNRGATYYAFARVGAEANAPAAVSAPLRIVLPTREPQLVVEPATFATSEYGYEEQPRQKLVLKNTGDGDAVIDDIEIADADVDEFDLMPGNSDLPAGGKNTPWEVLAPVGLTAGAHEGSATLYYHGEGEAPRSQKIEIPLAHMVAKKQRSVSLVVNEVNSTTVKVTAKPTFGTGDGKVQVALTKSGEQPADNSWQDVDGNGAYTFKDKAANTQYEVYARITGGVNHVDAQAVPLPVTTKIDGKGLNMSISMPETLEFDYDAAEPLRIRLENSGDTAVEVTSVTLSGAQADSFVVNKGASNTVEASKGVNEGYSVALKDNVAAGTHEATVTVEYQEKGVTRAAAPAPLVATVRVTVLPASRTISARVQEATDTTLTAAEAKPSQGGGVVEYACSTAPVAPEQGWSTNRTFTGLTPDTTYYLFARVQESADKNYEAAVSLPEPTATIPGVPALGVAMPSFGTVSFGYDAPALLPIALTNTGNGPAVIESVAVSSDEFTVVEGGKVVVSGPTNDSWKIAPCAGLGGGEHRATVTVSYRSTDERSELKTATGEVVFTVQPASRSLKVFAVEVGSSRIVARTELSAGSGAIEYALTEPGVEPIVSDWTSSSVFEGLKADTAYELHARVSGDANYADAQAGAVKVVTKAAGSEGGGSTGGSQGGGSTEGGSGQGNQGNQGNGGGSGQGGQGGSGSGPEGQGGSGSGSEGQNGTQAPGGTSGSGAGVGVTGGAGSNSGSGATGLPGTGDASVAGAAATGFAGVLAAAFGWRRRRKE